jgi:hypothetical protein
MFCLRLLDSLGFAYRKSNPITIKGKRQFMETGQFILKRQYHRKSVICKKTTIDRSNGDSWKHDNSQEHTDHSKGSNSQNQANPPVRSARAIICPTGLESG